MEIKEEKNITVYRIENIEGAGPYSYAFELGGNLSEFWQTRKHIKKNGCPTPKEDGLIPLINKLNKKNKHFLFGFKSKEQLNKWFTESELKILFKHGFKIKKYKAVHAYCTAHQVLFIQPKSYIRTADKPLDCF